MNLLYKSAAQLTAVVNFNIATKSKNREELPILQKAVKVATNGLGSLQISPRSKYVDPFAQPPRLIMVFQVLLSIIPLDIDGELVPIEFIIECLRVLLQSDFATLSLHATLRSVNR